MSHFVRTLSLLVAFLSIAALPSAAQITYTFAIEGFLDFSEVDDEQFEGESEYPFYFEFTIDPSLNQYVNEPYQSTTQTFYGFSRHAIVDSSISVGSYTWTAYDMVFLAADSGFQHVANFWLNADVVSETPTDLAMMFVNGDNHALSIGSIMVIDTSSYFTKTASLVLDQGGSAWSTVPFSIQPVAVPEPSAYGVMLGASAAFLVAFFRHRKR